MKSKAKSIFRYSAIKGRIKPAIQAILPNNETSTEDAALIFDAERDQCYAHSSIEIFNNILTIFTQEWVGIRAASGSLPTHKLAISKDAVIGPFALRSILDFIADRKIKTILVQGLSFGVVRAVRAVRASLPEIQILCVWHGAPAAWCYDEERSLANLLLECADTGVFNRISIMKRGAHVLHPNAVPYLVPNLPPNVNIPRIHLPNSGSTRVALFGSWNNTWKNMYSNITAACLTPKITNILSYNSVDIKLPGSEKVKVANYGGREAHLALLSTTDVVLNATILDCHPMVELEALAVGTPSIRSYLDLDFGENHPYEKLLTVKSPSNIREISETLTTTIAIPSKELAEIVSDYRDLVFNTSIQRYAEFIEG